MPRLPLRHFAADAAITALSIFRAALLSPTPRFTPRAAFDDAAFAIAISPDYIFAIFIIDAMLFMLTLRHYLFILPFH